MGKKDVVNVVVSCLVVSLFGLIIFLLQPGWMINALLGIILIVLIIIVGTRISKKNQLGEQVAKMTDITNQFNLSEIKVYTSAQFARLFGSKNMAVLKVIRQNRQTQPIVILSDEVKNKHHYAEYLIDRRRVEYKQDYALKITSSISIALLLLLNGVVVYLWAMKQGQIDNMLLGVGAIPLLFTLSSVLIFRVWNSFIDRQDRKVDQILMDDYSKQELIDFIVTEEHCVKENIEKKADLISYQAVNKRIKKIRGGQ